MAVLMFNDFYGLHSSVNICLCHTKKHSGSVVQIWIYDGSSKILPKLLGQK